MVSFCVKSDTLISRKRPIEVLKLNYWFCVWICNYWKIKVYNRNYKSPDSQYL